ncbi:MAG: 3-phosphoshikimate 1-carboxyvinyltransferase [Peptococcaceae bacterium]|nr:3-phosphoshikimate 1-carboxyvinyltransferase [Peptococcaceae bacterium]
MNVRILRPIVGGTVRAIASKSEAHRLLICAALAEGETFISCPERSEDIDATAHCLTSLGASIRHERNGFAVTPIDRHTVSNKQYTLDCSESGSTLRFLLPVCGALGLRVSFSMRGRLPDRPLSGLYDEMASHGCRLSEPDISPLICEGKLKPGVYTLPGNISSQFVSGLLFALPLLSGDSVIRVTDNLESRPYADMTLDTLRLFGIKITEDERQVFRVPGGQTFRSPKTVNVSGDWSNAAIWLSAGAIGKNAVICTGLDPDSRQGDRAIVELLARFGADTVCTDGSVTVSPGTICGIEIDAGDTPDLVPVLAAVAAVAEGRTIICNAGRLRIKESDRLRTVAASLSGLGADITETEDGLIIIGKEKLTGGQTESFGDHRIAMTAAIVSSVCDGNVMIHDADAVRKSYPGFWDDFNTVLGGVSEEF